MNINEKVENKELKKLIDKLIEEKDNNEMYDYYIKKIEEEILNNVKFLVVGEFVEDEEKGVIPKGNKISFPLLKVHSKDEFVLPVFTDWDEIYKWEEKNSKDIKAIVISFDDCVKILKDGKEIGIAINPFSQNLFLSQGKLEKLKRIEK